METPTPHNLPTEIVPVLLYFLHLSSVKPDSSLLSFKLIIHRSTAMDVGCKISFDFYSSFHTLEELP